MCLALDLSDRGKMHLPNSANRKVKMYIPRVGHDMLISSDTEAMPLLGGANVPKFIGH